MKGEDELSSAGYVQENGKEPLVRDHFVSIFVLHSWIYFILKQNYGQVGKTKVSH